MYLNIKHFTVYHHPSSILHEWKMLCVIAYYNKSPQLSSLVAMIISTVQFCHEIKSMKPTSHDTCLHIKNIQILDVPIESILQSYSYFIFTTSPVEIIYILRRWFIRPLGFYNTDQQIGWCRL